MTQISGFLVTNGGPHPADKWAEVTADTILDLIVVPQDSVSQEAAAARKAKRDLRPILFDIFNEHHERVQAHEQGQLGKVKDPAKVAAHNVDPNQHMPTALGKLNAALSVTPFAAHFAKPEVKEILRTILGQHTADVMHIERRWHQDRLNAAKGA